MSLTRGDGQLAWISPVADLLLLTALAILISVLVGGVVIVP